MTVFVVTVFVVTVRVLDLRAGDAGEVDLELVLDLPLPRVDDATIYDMMMGMMGRDIK